MITIIDRLGEEKRKKGYQRAFRLYGFDPRALQWQSQESMDIRHQQIVDGLSFKGKTILDIGCGFGNIVSQLEKKTNDFDYLGADIVPEFIQQAQKLYPKHRFIVADCFSSPLKESFDIVISSGTLNANLSKDSFDYRTRIIKQMFNQSKEVLVFNMAGSYPQPVNSSKSKVYYANSLEILKFCLTLTPKIVFKHHYHPRDFTIFIYK